MGEEKWHGISPPEAPEGSGLVRMDLCNGYNYFQYLGPNKTRHISLYNTNPMIDYIPSAFLNYAMTTVLYGNITRLQDYAKRLGDRENGNQDGIVDIYENKLPYYESL